MQNIQTFLAYLGFMTIAVAFASKMAGCNLDEIIHNVFWSVWGVIFYLTLKWLVEPKGY